MAEGVEALLTAEGVALVRHYNLLDQAIEGDARVPTQALLGLDRIAQLGLHLCGTEKARTAC